MPLLLANWRLIGMALMLLGVGGYVLHCEHVKKNWAEAKAIAERQNAENAKQAHRDLLNKERSDENYKRDMARLAADLKRLRNSRPSLLPPAAPGAADPDRACFSRADLTSALQRYRDGVVELLGEGAAAVEGLDEAKEWVRRR